MSAEPTPTHYPQCPYCNAEWSGKGYYVCGTFNNSGCHDTFPQSVRCKERSAHAATKLELEAMHERYNRTADTLNTVGDELGSTKRELEEAKTTIGQWNKKWMTAVDLAVKNGHEAEVHKERAEKAEARVAELEGWIGDVRKAYRVLICASESERREAIALLDLAFRKMGTLGQAMPAQTKHELEVEKACGKPAPHIAASYIHKKQ